MEKKNSKSKNHILLYIRVGNPHGVKTHNLSFTLYYMYCERVCKCVQYNIITFPLVLQISVLLFNWVHIVPLGSKSNAYIDGYNP